MNKLQDTELEKTILRSIIIDEDCFQMVADVLNPHMFTLSSHKLICKAFYELFDVSLPIDIITLSDRLGDAVKLDYLVELSSGEMLGAYIESHVAILKEKFIKRELLKVCESIKTSVKDEDLKVTEILDKAYNKINNLSLKESNKKEVKLGDLFAEQLNKAVKIYNKEITPGINTPLNNLTFNLGGFRPTELVILAARPGMGKSAFMMSCALKSAEQGKAVAVFSLEMGNNQIASRTISSEAEVDSNLIRNKGIDQDYANEIMRKLSSVAKYPIYLDDSAQLSINELRVKAKRLKSVHGIDIIFVDYIQLMKGEKGGSREQEISSISRGLKIIAKELNICVVALSQLSRALESRTNKRPILSDLRESGAIEQDADVVLFIYRDEYYTKDECQIPGIAEIIIGKNRGGGTGTSECEWVGQFTKFKELQEITTNYSQQVNTPF